MRILKTALAALAGMASAALPAAADSYTNSTQGTVANPGQPCNAAFTRTIAVTETTPVQDLDLSLLATHPVRGDLAAAIRSPGGTQVLLFFGGPNVANVNVTFDDEAPQAFGTGAHSDADGATAPPYGDRVRPSAALSAFDGINPQGNWLFLMCDNVDNGNSGLFRSAVLDFGIPAQLADLSLEIRQLTTPQVGQNFTLPIRITNDGAATASNVRASLVLGAGFTYQNVSGATRDAQGRFVLAGSLAAGESRDILVTLNVNATGPYTASSEIATSSRRDPDSGPANGIAGEDDTDSATYTPGQTPTNQPPTLQCALGRPVNTLDWDQWTSGVARPNDWPSASLTNSYTVNDVGVTGTFTGNTNRFIARNLAAGSTPTPVSDAQFTGGGLFGEGVILNVDFNAYSESVTITFNYGDTAIGAGGIQIPITDVDEGTWTDRIVATATLGPKSVPPVYTSGTSNIVENGGLTGTGSSANGQALGNSWITFESSVDTVTITYSNIGNTAAANNANAPATDPAGQVISIENLIYCDPEDPELSGQKTVESSNPDGYYLPGDTITYRLIASSAAGANVGADDVTLDDTLPGNLRFQSASVSGLGSAGSFDPALPAPNTDCAGDACRIRYTGGQLAREQSGEVVITATVK